MGRQRPRSAWGEGLWFWGLLGLPGLLGLAGLAPAAVLPPAAAPAGFERTAAEQAFLAAHPEIRVGIRSDWPPLDFVDSAVRPAGLGADILAEMNQLLGGVLRIQGGTYEENLRKVQARELDAVMDVVPQPDRAEFLGFTRPYLDIPQVLVGKRESRYYPSAKSLTGHSVALEKGADLIPWFQDNFPKVRIRQYETAREALDAVARGQVDVYAGNRAAALYLIERELLTNLHLQGRLESPAALALGILPRFPRYRSALAPEFDSPRGSGKERTQPFGWVLLVDSP